MKANSSNGKFFVTLRWSLLLLFLSVFKTAYADSQSNTDPQSRFHSVSIRGTFSSADVIGKKAAEDFSNYDVSASFKFPWAWEAESGWEADTRLMTSLGAIQGGEQTALTVSLIPQVAVQLRGWERWFALDIGAGGAVLSRSRFGDQDFGGHWQFAATGGLSIPLFKQLKLGYRYLHYSDAGLIGPDTTGADLHMLELIYLP